MFSGAYPPIERVLWQLFVVQSAETEVPTGFRTIPLEGSNAMIKKFARGLLALTSFGFGLLWAADAFTGTWKLNVGESKFAKGRELTDATVTSVEQGDNAMVTVKGTGGGGKAISTKYMLPRKGGTLNYTEGVPSAGAGATVVVKRVDANTIDGASTINGKQVQTIHSVISADGKTLTQTINGVDEGGKAYRSVLVYDRQ
jgi:hypothetical protein